VPLFYDALGKALDKDLATLGQLALISTTKSQDEVRKAFRQMVTSSLLGAVQPTYQEQRFQYYWGGTWNTGGRASVSCCFFITSRRALALDQRRRR
jgi:hypothetical protein